MKMSVTPKEIAEHLIDELGHQQAIEAYRHHLSRCRDSETQGIWTNIGQVLESINPAEKRH
ncbi:hypothetical protein RYZ26_11310 [Terasakiella sp. A23]|uniref:hypothetical protein n=1 Tax=Terasakiella sp. FCG-A23 TaxID=3080561 RepID=UPI00295303F9|nr:hypothetical protein [Terasakiella sp. A23]MDV7340185.1 hypothetical protein [Terasakiella sp. A23]